MNKTYASALLRKFGMLYYIDFVRFYIQKRQNASKNKLFKKKHPTVKLPPDYLMYESSRLDYDKYYFDGQDTASWLVETLEKYKPLENEKILDWGCGSARIVRHLPALLSSCEIYATDYNKKSIEWGRANIENVKFYENEINPPLNFEENYFDVIYGISILKHLSEKSHKDWMKELVRVTKQDGIILLTTQGNMFRNLLSKAEKYRFAQGELVIRATGKERHRVYDTFHPTIFMYNFFAKYATILLYIPGEIKQGKLEQDLWILKKMPD